MFEALPLSGLINFEDIYISRKVVQETGSSSTPVLRGTTISRGYNIPDKPS